MRPVRTIIFLLVCLGLIILAFILLKGIFTSGNSSNTTTNATAKLTGYARSGTTAQYVIDGPIVQNQAHRLLRMSVDAELSKIELLEGYNGSVLRQETYPNTTESYRAFLAALDNVGFATGIKDSKSTEEGKCPLQYRYVYTLTDTAKPEFRFWSTSCDKGIFAGQPSAVSSLFRRQFPGTVYDEMYRQLAYSR